MAARLRQRAVGFITANLIAFCHSKTVSKAVHAPPADGPCRSARRVLVGVNLISADGAPGVSVTVFVGAYALVADRACRSAVAVTVSADVLATDPACRVAVSISVRVHCAIAVYACRITRSIRVKNGALGVQRRNGYRQHQQCKDGAYHRTPLAFQNNYDVAAVLSNDTDLVEPIRIATQELGKPVGLLTPVSI
jgi:hypothetical protein